MKVKAILGSDRLDGVFNFLFSRLSLSDVHKIVEVSASSTLTGRGSPFTTIDPNAIEQVYTDCWVSDPVNNSNLTISFKHHLLSISSYTFQSRMRTNNNVPLEWIVEGTNDFQEWKTIHYKERGNEIVGNGIVHNWETSNHDFFHSYRITMIGENHHTYSEAEKFYFALGRIEFFGFLNDFNYTIPHHKCFQFHFSIFLNIIISS